MITLFERARAVQAFLERREFTFCFIGGIALQHWGEPRATRDLDLSVFTGFGGEGPIVDALLGHFGARIADAREFALQYRVLLLADADGVPIDVALAALPYEAELIHRAAAVEFMPNVNLRICSAEDLFVLKAFADRDQDRADILGIARRRGRQLDWDAVLQRLTPLVEAKEDLTILERVRVLRAEYEG